MWNTFSRRLWLFLALTVIVYLAFTALRAEAQEKGRINSSLSILTGESNRQCLTQSLNVQRNVSIVGKTIFAECSCMHLNTRLCTVWKLSNTTSQLRLHIKVFTKFSTGVLGRVLPGATGTCEEYTRTINKLYGSDHELNYSTAQDAKACSIDWSFCDNVPLRNDLGCNYTIVPTNVQSSSVGLEEIHYYVPTFRNASQHLKVGKIYQLDIDKCQHTAVEIAIRNESFLPISTEDSLFFVVKTRSQTSQRDVTVSTAPETSGNRMCLSGNDFLYIAPLAALFLRMF